MKILLCLNKDLHGILALNYLRSILDAHTVKITFTEEVGKRARFSDLDDLVFMEQTLPCTVLFPLIEQRKDANGAWLTFNEILQQCRIEQLRFDHINRDGLTYLEAWKPDLIVSIRFGKIFCDAIAKLPTFGIINLHSGILPKYRGILSTFWAMLDDEDTIGTTLHRVTDSQIDRGEIIAISRIDTQKDKSLMHNIASLYRTGCMDIIAHIRTIEARTPATIHHASGPSYYHSHPSEADFHAFKKRYKVYDHSEYYREWISRFIRP